METDKQIIEKLGAQGYDRVYVWDAAPNEEDSEHSHEFDTKLHVLSGSIRIKLLSHGRTDDHTLVAGKDIEISKHQLHSAVAGPEGCKYVVAERR